jgi:hypothetical protein
LAVDKFQPPPPKNLFPPVMVDAGDWRAWERSPATLAVLHAVWRRIEEIKRVPFKADALANQLRIGQAQGLEEVLRLIAQEEVAACGSDEDGGDE